MSSPEGVAATGPARASTPGGESVSSARQVPSAARMLGPRGRRGARRADAAGSRARAPTPTARSGRRRGRRTAEAGSRLVGVQATRLSHRILVQRSALPASDQSAILRWAERREHGRSGSVSLQDTAADRAWPAESAPGLGDHPGQSQSCARGTVAGPPRRPIPRGSSRAECQLDREDDGHPTNNPSGNRRHRSGHHRWREEPARYVHVETRPDTATAHPSGAARAGHREREPAMTSVRPQRAHAAHRILAHGGRADRRPSA